MADTNDVNTAKALLLAAENAAYSAGVALTHASDEAYERACLMRDNAHRVAAEAIERLTRAEGDA